MAFYYKDGSTWRTVAQPSYNDGGTWRTLTEVHYHDGSAWRLIFPSFSASDVSLSDGSQCSVSYYNSGLVEHYTDTSGTVAGTRWWLPEGGTPGTGKYIKFIQTSGNPPDSGSTLDTWHQLNGTRFMTVSSTNSFVMTVQFSSDGGTTVHHSVTVSLTVT